MLMVEQISMLQYYECVLPSLPYLSQLNSTSSKKLVIFVRQKTHQADDSKDFHWSV